MEAYFASFFNELITIIQKTAVASIEEHQAKAAKLQNDQNTTPEDQLRYYRDLKEMNANIQAIHSMKNVWAKWEDFAEIIENIFSILKAVKPDNSSLDLFEMEIISQLEYAVYLSESLQNNEEENWGNQLKSLFDAEKSASILKDTLLSPKIFETAPDEYFCEMARLLEPYCNEYLGQSLRSRCIYLRGMNLNKAGNFIKATECLQQAFEVHPDMHLYQEKKLSDQEKVQEIQNILRERGTIFKYIHQYENAFDCFIQGDHFGETKDCYSIIIDIDKANWKVHEKFATYMKEHRVASFIEFYYMAKSYADPVNALRIQAIIDHC